MLLCWLSEAVCKPSILRAENDCFGLMPTMSLAYLQHLESALAGYDFICLDHFVLLTCLSCDSSLRLYVVSRGTRAGWSYVTGPCATGAGDIRNRTAAVLHQELKVSVFRESSARYALSWFLKSCGRGLAFKEPEGRQMLAWYVRLLCQMASRHNRRTICFRHIQQVFAVISGFIPGSLEFRGFKEPPYHSPHESRPSINDFRSSFS